MKDLLGRLRTAWRRRRFSAWQIELTTRCPLACRMCGRQGRDWRNEDMSLEDFARLAPHLRQVETVILQGWGEPLLHRNLVDVVRLAKSAGRDGASAPSVGFVTSGKGIDRQRATALVDAGLDFVGFSLAGTTADTHGSIRVHSDFEEPMAAAALFRDIRRDRGLDRPRTHAVYLMLKANIHEMPGLPDVARRMGVDEIVLTNLIDVADAWQDEQKAFRCDGQEEFQEVVEETERRARELKLSVRRAPLSPRVTAVCEEDPLKNLFVTAQGDVTPCVYLCPPTSGEFTRRYCGRERPSRKIRFGNLFREPLDAIWRNPEYQRFRNRFVRRARGYRLLSAIGSASGKSPGTSPIELPDPPEPCQTCHKMLGV